jgi:hypothetical protein
LPERPFSNILERMEVHFTPEQEARLAEIAIYDDARWGSNSAFALINLLITPGR